MNILIGADPEIFARQNGKFVSAYGMVKGDKKNPQPVRNGAVQVDGMALEFNINPAATEEEFLHNISDVMGQLQAMIPEGTEMIASPVAEFGSKYIEAQPSEAKTLGCDPDFNAWTGGQNVPPNAELPFRTGSGHVHIGWTNKADVADARHLLMSRDLVKQLDFYLGLPSLLLDGDTKRREMYGKAGAFRPKPYGCEYRTLSNFWLTDSKLMSLVYNNTKAAISNLLLGNSLKDKYGDVQQIINYSKKNSAIEILEEEGIRYAL